MKTRNLLPLIVLLISFTSCVTTTETYAITPNYSISEKALKSSVAAIIPAETINFSAIHTEISGGTEYNTLNVEILTKKLPGSGNSFSRLADDIQSTIESGIRDIEDYKTLIIEVRVTDNGDEVKTNRSYKKEVNL